MVCRPKATQKEVAVDIIKFCNEELHVSIYSYMCEVKDEMRHCSVTSGSSNDCVPANVLMIAKQE